MSRERERESQSIVERNQSRSSYYERDLLFCQYLKGELFSSISPIIQHRTLLLLDEKKRGGWNSLFSLSKKYREKCIMISCFFVHFEKNCEAHTRTYSSFNVRAIALMWFGKCKLAVSASVLMEMASKNTRERERERERLVSH